MEPIRLNAETLQAFTTYVADAEASMRATTDPFLWADADLKRSSEVAKGKVLAQFWSGTKPIHVPQGLIHDWVGAAYIPRVKVSQVLRVVQDYDNHKQIYKPDVMESKLVTHAGDDFKIFLRLLKKKVISVVLDTEHAVHYSQISATRWTCWSHTTSISEVQNADAKDQKILQPDTGHGFLWRLNSYWRFEEKQEDVSIECRAISLSRDVPKALAWIIDPIVGKVPKESLINTLNATRKALHLAESPA
ncbi:hypothetical protein [Candidatus Korobacter versatilis]|uniref:hypothetical protein n=1 Tax=Candidatus Korobacter versatilis TaxID=658062 RepID=UPI0011D1317E|nr:hypothetical protein [Candidatus Koribacter versatilis]